MPTIDDQRPSVFEALTSSPLFLVCALLSVAPIVGIVLLFAENHPGEDRLGPAIVMALIAAFSGSITVKIYKRTLKLCREGELAAGRVRNFGLAYRGFVNITYTYPAGQAIHEGRVSVPKSQIERLRADPSIPIFYDPQQPSRHVVGRI